MPEAAEEEPTVNRWTPLVLLTVLAAAVRFATLDVQSFWYDEALTVGLVNGSFGDMLEGVFNTQAQPPPYFILAWIWAHVFGDGEVGLRSLSALLGTLTVPVVYFATDIVAGRRVALVAGILTALSPPLIWYSQEARGYALLTLLAALSLLFFLKALERPNRRNLALWTLTSLIAVASHYFVLFIVLPAAAWLLWRGVERRTALPYIGAIGVGLIAIAPMLLYQREHGGADWIGRLDFSARLKDTAVFFAGGPLLPGPISNRAIVAVAAVLVFALTLYAAFRWTHGLKRERFVAVLTLGIAGVALPLAAALVGFDFFLDRNLLPAWVPLAIVAAVGLSVLRPRWLGRVLTVLPCLLFVVIGIAVPTEDHLQRDDWRTVAETLGPATRDRVVEAVPFWQGEGLRVYEPGLEPMTEPRRVSRVVVVSLDAFPTLPPSRLFQEARTLEFERIRVTEYTAPQPVLVKPETLTGVGRDAAMPLFEPAADAP